MACLHACAISDIFQTTKDFKLKNINLCRRLALVGLTGPG